jgi:DMSO reductase anchor subunit
MLSSTGVFRLLERAGAVCQHCLVIMQGVELSDIQSSVQRAGALVPNYAALQIWRIALLALGSAAGSARFAGTKPRARPVCSSDCCWFWPQNLLAAACFMVCI